MVDQEVDTAAGTAVVDADAIDRRNALGSTSDGVLARVRNGLAELTGALRRVAEHVLSDPEAAARSTIVELAERSGTSPATITRFCRVMGFEDTPTCGWASPPRPAGHARPAGPSTSDARSSRATRSPGCSTRSWPPTPGPCTTRPPFSISPRSSGPRWRSPAPTG